MIKALVERKMQDRKCGKQYSLKRLDVRLD
jgi:hypothetical protein